METDFTRHKQIDPEQISAHPVRVDLELLLRIRQQFWREMNNHQRGQWAAYWDRVYFKQRPLKQAFLQALAETVNQFAEQKRQQRQPRQQKSTADIVAKTVDTCQSPPWD